MHASWWMPHLPQSPIDTTLHSLLAHAMRFDLVENNPAAGVRGENTGQTYHSHSVTVGTCRRVQAAAQYRSFYTFPSEGTCITQQGDVWRVFGLQDGIAPLVGRSGSNSFLPACVP